MDDDYFSFNDYGDWGSFVDFGDGGDTGDSSMMEDGLDYGPDPTTIDYGFTPTDQETVATDPFWSWFFDDGAGDGGGGDGGGTSGGDAPLPDGIQGDWGPDPNSVVYTDVAGVGMGPGAEIVPAGDVETWLRVNGYSDSEIDHMKIAVPQLFAGDSQPMSQDQFMQASGAGSAAADAAKKAGASSGGGGSSSSTPKQAPQQAAKTSAALSDAARQAAAAGQSQQAKILDTAAKAMAMYAAYQNQSLGNSNVLSSAGVMRMPDGSMVIRNPDGTYSQLGTNGQVATAGSLSAFMTNNKTVLMVVGAVAIVGGIFLLAKK